MVVSMPSKSIPEALRVETPSLCGSVRLLAAIFGENENRLLERYGLSSRFPKQHCIQCGAIHKSKTTPYCQKCNSWIEVECDECGIHFKRLKSDLIAGISKQGYKHIFCSSQCNGRHAGKHYGFAVHPENSGRKRKWDYAQVYQLKDYLGWGGVNIGRALGIPSSTVTWILAGRRENE